KQLEQAECDKLKGGDEAYYWTDTESAWIRTSFIRVCSDNANIVRLQAQRSVSAQHVFTKLERQGCHAPALAVAVSDARQAASASGDMRVDQYEEVENALMLYDIS
ncbi:MAG: hypothetical protein ACKPKO_59880, partial [Candidatus Fonsibacter sp.]